METSRRTGTLLIKITGELLDSPKILRFIEKMRSQADEVVVLVGGGAQINEELTAQFPTYRMVKRLGGRYHGNLDPRVKTEMDRIAYRVLIQNRKEFATRLAAAGIDDVVVMIPVLSDKAGVLCHVDGDLYATVVCCNGYDEVIIVTYDEATKAAKLAALKPWFDEYPGKFTVLSPADITAILAAPTTPTTTALPQKPPASRRIRRQPVVRRKATPAAPVS